MLLKACANSAISSLPVTATRVSNWPAAMAAAPRFSASMLSMTVLERKNPSAMAMPAAKTSRIVASVRSCLLMNMSRAVTHTLMKVSTVEST